MAVAETQEQTKLIRAIDRWDLLALTINGIIGAGIFGVPSVVAKQLGAASLFAYVGCAFIVGCIVLCFAEASSLFAGTGGPYIYTRAAFGNFVGFQVGWMLWLARLTAFGANCNLFISYLSYFYPRSAMGSIRTLAVTLTLAVLTIINVRGVKQSIRMINIFTVGKLLPLAIFIAIGVFFVDSSNFVGATHINLSNVGKSLLVLVYAFTGFEYTVIPAGEAKDPRRDSPRALLTGLAVISVFYILIQLVCIGTLPALASANKPLAEASERFMGRFGGSLISFGALVSIAGNLSSITMVAPRLTYAFAEDGNMPRFLAAIHSRYRTPYVSIVLFAIASWGLTVFGSFEWLLTLSAIARTISYVATCVAVPVLRNKLSEASERFMLPGGLVIPSIATLLSVWLLTSGTGANMKLAVYSILAGVIIFGISKRMYKKNADKSLI